MMQATIYNGPMVQTGTIQALTETFAVMTRTAASPALMHRIHELSGVTLHRSALATVWRLANFGPQLISELAEGVGVDVSTMSRLLRQLERDGLVARGRHGSDQRCVQIALTPAGVRAHERVSAARTAMLTEILEDWPERDRAAFVRLLGRFAEDLTSHLEQPQVALAAT